MAIVAHLVTKTVQPGDSLVNGVTAALIAIDDAVETTDALILQAAVDQYNVIVGAGVMPSPYFDLTRLVSTEWNADDDVSFFQGSAEELIA
jgi:hypothetical protein